VKRNRISPRKGRTHEASLSACQEAELPSLWEAALDDERRLVTSCLLTPALLSKCGGVLPAHFTNSDCRAIWSVMAKFSQQGVSWDSSSVVSELGRQGLAQPELTLVRVTEGVVETTAVGRAAAKVRQMSVRCRAVKEVQALLRSLLDQRCEPNQSLKLLSHAVDRFKAENETCGAIFLDESNSAGSAKGDGVLNEVAAFITRFVILSDAQLVVISLWIAHTWAFEASDATPYLAVTSAEMRSGKTRLLEILELLVRNPWRTGRVTPAALYRKIEADTPSLLLDEWDAIVGSGQDFSETLRGILNAGHRRNGKVSVCGPKNAGYQPTDFRVFCPKVIAGIGKLPDTLADRSIQIRLKRKALGAGGLHG
jgi:hypothetical protein